jgi:chromosome segregation ATPase
MNRHAEIEAGEGTPAGGAATPRQTSRPPNLGGDLEQVLDHRPLFRRRHRGYDRFQVDNYVAWAEGEVDAARRQCDLLLERYGACVAELTVAQRAPVAAPTTGVVSQRLGEMLRLASQEADAVVAAGVDEAERIVAEGRMEAAARLQKVAGIREAAMAAADELRTQAQRDAEQLMRTSATELQAAEADAARRLAAVQAEVDDLRRQRDDARESLHRLTAQIGQALQAVATGDAEELAVLADRHAVGSALA